MVITYDSPELQQAFTEAGSITYPFISDIDTDSMRALDILNENYEPGDSAYGIPHPGVFVLNTDQQIVGKIFLESFRERVDAENTLAYALTALD